MLTTRGWSQIELGDPDVLAWEDRLHLFTPTRSAVVVDHFVSDDGMHWEHLPNAITIGAPGEPDDDQIWTEHVFRWQDRFYMLYTCLSKKEDGRLQRTALAVSDDLVHWEKVAHNPIAAPDPRWYEADLASSGRADWRDPCPWIEDGVIHALICAHEKDGPLNRRGCIARISSRDALHWQVQPPFYTPRISTDFEVPFVFKLNGRYYLTGHICAPPIDVYRIADGLDGPWRRPMDDVLLPAPNHAFHGCTWRGKMMMFNWIQMEDDWTGIGGTARIMAPPKTAEALPDGRLALRTFEAGWDAVAAGPWQAPSPEGIANTGNAYRGEWGSADDGLTGVSHPGMGIQFLGPEPSNFIFEAAICSSDAPEVGVVFRTDETADQCTRVSCLQGSHTVSLAKVTRRLNYNAIGRGYQALQSRFHAFAPGDPFRLRVTAYGPYVEVCVDDRVLLAALTMARRRGGLGVFVEDGTARFSDLRLRALRPPELRMPAGPVKETV